MNSAKARDQLGMAAAAKPWTGRPETQLRGLPEHAERVKDLLDIAYWEHRAAQGDMASGDACPEKVVAGLWANISQDVSRCPWCVGSIPTFTTSSEMYSFTHDCVLSGHAHLRLMGYPDSASMEGDFREKELKQFAGEAFSVPCISLVLNAYYLNPWAPWWRNSRSSAAGSSERATRAP